MRRAAVVAAVLAVGCINGRFRPGAQLPARTLERHAADLGGLVAKELAAGRTARAFFVLEAEKTRPYAGARFIAGKYGGDLGDLRPLFATVFRAPEDMVASRGLRLTRDNAPVNERASLTAEADDLYWRHLRAAEKSLGDFSKQYGRNTFATVTSVEASILFAPDEVFISYFVHGDEVVAFALTGGKLASHRLSASARDIARANAALMAVLSVPPESPDDDRWKAPAAKLYELVLAPIPEAAEAKVLYISPDGPLSNVAFDVLVDATGQPLIERGRVTYLHSATVYRYLLQRPLLDASPQFLAIGNPVYPAGVPDLPAAAREAETLALVFDGGRAMIGADATEQAVVAQLAEHNILHFATHGVLLGTELPGASSIMLTANDGDDGFLSAAELVNIDLTHTYLAVLSACQTSVTSGGGGSSDLSSIAGAFMIAGAPTVVGSLWNVSDASTTRLMLAFYGEFLTAGAGEAMARAKRAMRKDPRFAHPYYWAAFLLYGWDK